MNQCWASCDIYIHIYRLMNNVFFSITLLQSHRFIKRIDHNWWRICRAEIYELTKCKKEILSYNHNFHIGKHIDSLTEAKFRDNKKSRLMPISHIVYTMSKVSLVSSIWYTIWDLTILDLWLDIFNVSR
jgi:hypothetical protein